MNPSLLQRHLDSRNKTELLAYAATYYGAKTLFITLDPSALTILPPWVRIPSTCTHHFFQFKFELECEKDENKQEEAEIGPFYKTSSKKQKG